MDLFDIIKTWVETNYPDMIVERLNGEGNTDSQIRISVMPGLEDGVLNSIVAIYEEPYKGRVIYYRSAINKFWNDVFANPCQHDYFEKLKMAVGVGLSNYEKWIKNDRCLE